ncbi:hypothetical protein PtB15_5B416 [Puccinia triticina]|nr:hypothetical protein PtB15_5B416 [Puccinia triticina]
MGDPRVIIRPRSASRDHATQLGDLHMYIPQLRRPHHSSGKFPIRGSDFKAHDSSSAMAPSRRNRQLAGSSMLLNEPRRPGRFRAPRSRTNPQDEATRIAASTQLAEDFGMLPPRQIRPTYVPLPAANDDQRWMDVDQNRPENQDAYRPAILHARYHRLQRYAAIRQQRSDEWLQLVNQATATYLFCQQSSRNWTSVKFPAECVPYDCTCPPGGIHHRSVDLIGLPGKSINVFSLFR